MWHDSYWLSCINIIDPPRLDQTKILSDMCRFTVSFGMDYCDMHVYVDVNCMYVAFISLKLKVAAKMTGRAPTLRFMLQHVNSSVYPRASQLIIK